MAVNISGNGIEVSVVGSVTFPSGFNVTQFADDSDPFDLPEIQIAETAMGVSGDLVVWNTPNPITFTLSVIPGSEDDKNLAILFEENRVAKKKKSAKDVITVTGIYPDGSKITLVNGAITNGMPGNSVASAGRLKSKTYTFAFENKN